MKQKNVKKKSQKSSENAKWASVLSYIIVGMLWYAIDDKLKNDTLATHHVKQALNLLIFAVVFSVISWILSIVAFVLLFIPVLGWIISGAIGLFVVIVHIIIFVLWVFGLIFAFNSDKKDIPIIGKYAKKYLKF